MMFVAELYRLLAADVLVRPIGSPRDSNHAAHAQPGYQQSSEHTESSDKVRAAVKNLRHFRFCTCAAERPGKERFLRRSTES
jgi:hypothetical protein